MSKAPRISVPLRPDYGTGVFRRKIRLTAGPGIVRGELEDDFHHFAVKIHHDGLRVQKAEGEAARFPWSTCPGAIDPLTRLTGLPLTRSLRSIARHTDPRSQCTHLFDVASLAISLAASDATARSYDIAVPDRVDARTRATLACDGRALLQWNVVGVTIEGPEPFGDRTLVGGGFSEWTEAKLDVDTAEAAQTLRRAILIALGRNYDMDQVPRAASFRAAAGSACHTFSDEIVSEARRVLGTFRDFTLEAERLLADEPEDSHS